MSSHVRALMLSGMVLALSTSACGNSSVTSSAICDVARPLRIQVADSDTANYAAHAAEWYKLIDMAKNAEDSDLAEFAELVDEKSRNSPRYYMPLIEIEQSACDGEKPDKDDAG